MKKYMVWLGVGAAVLIFVCAIGASTHAATIACSSASDCQKTMGQLGTCENPGTSQSVCYLFSCPTGYTVAQDINGDNICSIGGGNSSGSGGGSLATVLLTVNGSTGGTFMDTQAWTLSVSSDEAGQPFTFCWVHNNASLPCVKNYGTTDSAGRWSASGNFDPSTDGSWTESVQFADGSSASVQFTVGGSTSTGTGSTGGSAGTTGGSTSVSNTTTPPCSGSSCFVSQSSLTTTNNPPASEDRAVSTQDVNQTYYATQAAAQWLASQVGGTAVEVYDNYEANNPYNSLSSDAQYQWFIQMPDGTLVNAGQLLQYYNQYSASYANQIVQQQVQLTEQDHQNGNTPYNCLARSSNPSQLPSPNSTSTMVIDSPGQVGPVTTSYGTCGSNPSVPAASATAGSSSSTTKPTTTASNNPSTSGNATNAVVGNSGGVSGSSISGAISSIQSALQAYRAGNPATTGTTNTVAASTNTTTTGNQALLSVLEQSLTQISTSMASQASSITPSVATSVQGVVNSIAQLIQMIEGGSIGVGGNGSN